VPKIEASLQIIASTVQLARLVTTSSAFVLRNHIWSPAKDFFKFSNLFSSIFIESYLIQND
jgi:hypothetical protein